MDVNTQFCTGCKIYHPIMDFPMRNNTLRIRCKQCREHLRKVANDDGYQYLTGVRQRYA